VRLLSSLKLSQNSLPLECRMACCLKLLESPVDRSAIISSSGMPSRESCVGPIFGDECVVPVVDIEWCRGSRSISLSRVRRTTSASRRTSVSIGALSSARAARIRANVFVLGCYNISGCFGISYCLLTNIFPLLVTALRMTPLCPSRPGVTGMPSAFSNVDFRVPSSLSLPEICN